MKINLAIAGMPFALLLQSTSGAAAAREVGPVAPSEANLGSGETTTGVRHERLFLDADGGAAYVDTLALKSGALWDPARWRPRGFGLICGAAFGVRLQEFTLAIRYRYGDFSGWRLWTLGGEARMNFPLGRVEHFFGFGAGYASVGGLRADTTNTFTPDSAPAVDIDGLNVRVSVGVTYYVSRWFSVGANVSGDAFFLRRKGDRLPRTWPTDPNASAPFPYATSGSGNGLGAALGLVVGVHY